MTDTNHGTTLLCLTAVLPLADLETLKARIAGWSDAERQTAIDWAVARLTGAVEPEVPTHVAPFLAVRESTSALPETFRDEPLDEAVVFEVIETAATEPAPFVVISLPTSFHERGA